MKSSKVKQHSNEVDIINEKINFIPRSEEYYIKDPTKNNISKIDTSVPCLKNSNKQESIILENVEVDCIYDNNLNNIFLSEGTLQEGMIDEASESLWDYLPLPLSEVAMKSSKVKPARKKTWYN